MPDPKPKHNMIPRFKWKGMDCDGYRLVDAAGVVVPEDIAAFQMGADDVFSGLPPIYTAWAHQAMDDVRLNVVEERYLGAGSFFGSTVFTRDTALSGVLSLNRLQPQLMRESLRYDRELRLKIGWKSLSHSSAVATVPELPFEDSGLDEKAFMETYRTNEFARRTDDVVWMWGYLDWLRTNDPGMEEWLWFYETGGECFERFYDLFQDLADGLYRGQSCFVDIMMCGYRVHHGPPVAGDLSHFKLPHIDDASNREKWDLPFTPITLRDSVLQKAASTNALYVIALNGLAEAAERLGFQEASRQWHERAHRLRQAMRKCFLQGDGSVAYTLYADGELDMRLHPLATAFWVLAGVLEGGEAYRALARHPLESWGVPLYTPFYEENPHCYHNRSAWPFVDAFHFLAQWSLRPDEDVLRTWLVLNGRACRDRRGFRELLNMDTGELIGSAHQLWSAAGYLGALMRWTGMESKAWRRSIRSEGACPSRNK